VVQLLIFKTVERVVLLEVETLAEEVVVLVMAQAAQAVLDLLVLVSPEV
jgi:hypothetical protein